MTNDTIINIKINSTTKNEFGKVCDQMGLSMSSAIKLYISQVIKENNIIVDLKQPKERGE